MSVASALQWDTSPAKPLKSSLRSTREAGGPEKPKVEDRWVTESHRSFTYYIPLNEPYRPDAITRLTDAHVVVVPTQVAVEHGLDPQVTLSLDPKQPPKVTQGCQTDAIVTGMKSDTKKIREAALAAAKAKREAQRLEQERVASSRFLANSAFTRIYSKAAFHNYGTGNRQPLQDANYMASFSINPLLHPASDKGKTLLKAPRRQVVKTAVIHAKYDGRRYDPSATKKNRDSSAARRLLIQEEEDTLRKEVSLAAKEDRSKSPKKKAGAPTPRKSNTPHVIPPALPEPSRRRSIVTFDADESTEQLASPGFRDTRDQRNRATAATPQQAQLTPALAPPAPTGPAVDARLKRMELKARGYDSSGVKSQLAWGETEPMPRRRDLTASHQPTSTQSNINNDTIEESVIMSAIPNQIPVIMTPFQVKGVPAYNPKEYKHLPAAWTSLIRPAGVPTGGGALDVSVGSQSVIRRDNVSEVLSLYD